MATAVDSMFPSGLADNDDYTSIVNRAHYDRLMSYIQDAGSRGAEVIELCPAENPSLMSEQLKIAPKVITGLTDEMSIMQEEIFGPVLPIIPYDKLQTAIRYINDRARPLGLYYLGSDVDESEAVISETGTDNLTAPE